MEYDPVFVWLRLKALCASESAAIPLEKLRAGGPQFVESWLFPEISAAPETF